MLKARVGKLEDFIKEETEKNGGNPPKLIGANGFKMDLTVDNYNKLKDICVARHEQETKIKTVKKSS